MYYDKKILTELRVDANLSIEELSSMIEIPVKSLKAIESGFLCDVSALNKLAKFYNINISHFIIRKDNDAILEKAYKFNDRYAIFSEYPSFFKENLYNTYLSCSEIAEDRAKQKYTYIEETKKVEDIIKEYVKNDLHSEIDVEEFVNKLEWELKEKFYIEAEELFYLGIQTGCNLYKMLNQNFLFNRSEEAFLEKQYRECEFNI